VSYFSGSKKVAVGLDIENDAVRMVKLRYTREGPKLVAFGVVELPPGDKDSGGTQRSRISSAIEKILAQEKIKGKEVISAISGPSVHIQVARLPSLPGEKLREAAKWMMKEKAPFDLEETTLDYSMLDKTTDNGTQKLETIVAVAKNELVREKVDLLKGVGLNSVALNVIPLALLNSFKVDSRWKKDEVIALVDIEASTTYLAIVKNARLEFSREIAFGGDTITEGLKQRLDLSDPGSGKKMRQTYGILDEDSDKETEQISYKATEKGKAEIQEEKEKAFKVSEILKIELGKLVSELRLSFNSYQAQSLEDSIGRILLSGSLAQLKNLDGFLAATLKVPVEIANPLARIPLDSQFEKRKYQNPQSLSPSLNIATGLALGKGETINLSPAKEKSARLARRTRTILLPSLYLTALLLLLASGYSFLNQKAAVYEQEFQSKEAMIAPLQPKLDKVEALMRDLIGWDHRHSSIIQLNLSSIPWVQVLAQFSKAIPEKAWLRELSFPTSPTDTDQRSNSPILIIRGSVEWEKQVAQLSLIEFVSQLEKSPYLNDVYSQSTARNTRHGHEVIDFVINARLPNRKEIASSTHHSDERAERSANL